MNVCVVHQIMQELFSLDDWVVSQIILIEYQGLISGNYLTPEFERFRSEAFKLMRLKADSVNDIENYLFCYFNIHNYNERKEYVEIRDWCKKNLEKVTLKPDEWGQMCDDIMEIKGKSSETFIKTMLCAVDHADSEFKSYHDSYLNYGTVMIRDLDGNIIDVDTYYPIIHMPM